MKKYIPHIALALILSACGPAFYLKKAERAINKAIEKGAKVTKDTVTAHFKSPEIKFETTFTPTWIDGAPIPLWRDTLIATDEKTGSTVKAKIDLKAGCPEDCIERIYLAAKVPPQDQSVDVPCQTVKAGYTLWEMIILAIACLPVGWLLFTFVLIPLLKRR